MVGSAGADEGRPSQAWTRARVVLERELFLLDQRRQETENSIAESASRARLARQLLHQKRRECEEEYRRRAAQGTRRRRPAPDEPHPQLLIPFKNSSDRGLAARKAFADRLVYQAEAEERRLSEEAASRARQRDRGLRLARHRRQELLSSAEPSPRLSKALEETRLQRERLIRRRRANEQAAARARSRNVIVLALSGDEIMLTEPEGELPSTLLAWAKSWSVCHD